MSKTYEEINDKIRKRQAIVVTAEEIVHIVARRGIERTAREVDVVTTGTFGAMCSSGAFFNIGHSRPRINASRIWLNGVEAYAGIAAADCYLGATKRSDDRRYGGGHVIHELAAGGRVGLRVEGHGSDCYPGKCLERTVSLEEMPDAFLFCPRNGYQNYNCAVNLSGRPIHTYMGVLKPRLGNATYSGAGSLSPLINDPFFRTIGIGTRIFLGGGIGYVTGPGTQHNPDPPRLANGVPARPAGTIAVTGDLKQMKGTWLKGVHIRGYGTSLMVGLGIPIPLLNEEVLRFTAVSDDHIHVPVIDYSSDYPDMTGDIIDEVSVAEIRAGSITIERRHIPVYSLSNQKKARMIALLLKEWIESGRFQVSSPVAGIPAVDPEHNPSPAEDGTP
ncbi:homocysteine biosynthesis protein [bacterium]|nr:homocysteine biosynthesis protein [bacterium]